MPRIFGSASTGSGGTPGGSTTQVQYNNAGAFGGVTGATTNGTFLTLTTPVLGVATGTSLALGGATIGSHALAVTGTAVISSSLFANQLLSANSIWLQGADNRVIIGGAADTGLSRISAGVIGVGTGAQGSVAGGLQAATLALGGATIGSNALAVTGSIETNASIISNQNIYTGTNGVFAFGNTRAFLKSPADGVFQVLDNSQTNGFLVSAPLAIASATFQHGAMDAASPVAQTIKFQDVVAGTSNTAGVNATIQAPAGTGTGAGGSLIFQVAPAGSTGTAKNAWSTALTIAPNGSATFANAIISGATIQLPPANSISWGGTRGYLSQAADGAYTFTSSAANSFTITAGASNLATFNGGVTVSGVTTSTGKAVIQSGSGLEFTANTGFRLIPTGDGVAAIQNIGGTAFSHLQFGGTTSSFPAWKRSTTSLQARLADDSAFTAIQGKLTTDTAYTAGDPTTTGYLLVYDSTGTAYRVPALLN